MTGVFPFNDAEEVTVKVKLGKGSKTPFKAPDGAGAGAGTLDDKKRVKTASTAEESTSPEWLENLYRLNKGQLPDIATGRVPRKDERQNGKAAAKPVRVVDRDSPVVEPARERVTVEQERPTIVVEAAPQPSMAEVRIEAERVGPIPILSRTGVDLAAEKRKLKILPQMSCSTCTIGPECPEYQEGYVCAYEDSFRAYPTRDLDAVMELMAEVVDENKARWRRQLLIERVVNGGMQDPNTTRLGEVVAAGAEKLLRLQQEAQRVTVTASGPATAEGGAQVGGILSKLFGQRSEPQTAIEVNPELPEAQKDELLTEMLEAADKELLPA